MKEYHKMILFSKTINFYSIEKKNEDIIFPFPKLEFCVVKT